MPRIEVLDEEHVVLETEYRDRDLVRAIPGATWQRDARVWRAPLSWAACVQARGMFGDRLEIGPRLVAWATHERETRIDPCLALRTAGDAVGVDDRGTGDLRLFPFQRAGVAFMVVAGSALNSDEMGTGKTPMTIKTLETLPDAYPALIVCTNSMKYTWEEEFGDWAPDRKVVVVHGGMATRRKQLAVEADVYVINWESLFRHSRLAGYGYIKLTDKEKELKELNEREWNTVVADEAHRAKSPKAKQTRALWAIGDGAGHRYALTGTPIANSPEDLWAIARFVEKKEWPSKTKFVDRYALSSWSAFGFNEVLGLRGDTKDELFAILDPRFIRRPKAAVLPQLPPKIPALRTVELPTKQRKAYDQLRKDLLAELDSGVLVAINPLKRLTRLVQLAAAYGELDGDKYRLSEPSCKVDAMLDIADELGETQAVVFAESRQLIELVAAKLGRKHKVAQLTGAVPVEERTKNVKALQAGEVQFLLCTLGAGAESITLTAASVAVFLQRSFSLVKNAQAEDRLHRQGQEADTVEIIDVVGKDTIESRIHETFGAKREKLEEIARDEETVRAWLTK